MLKKSLLSAIFPLLLLSGCTQKTDEQAANTSLPPAPTMTDAQTTTPQAGEPIVTMETSKGTIQIRLFPQDAPKTVENFVGLIKKGYYDNLVFHRVIPGFMIQGGDPTGTGMGGESLWGGTFADELNPATVSYQNGYKKGVVAMANAGPNTNGSQFFIMTADYPLPNAYTIFGQVISGQDAVDKIAAVDRDRNDKPLTPMVMTKVTME